jgi:hypothetical protein
MDLDGTKSGRMPYAPGTTIPGFPVVLGLRRSCPEESLNFCYELLDLIPANSSRGILIGEDK